jgi:hypothetical protein
MVTKLGPNHPLLVAARGPILKWWAGCWNRFDGLPGSARKPLKTGWKVATASQHDELGTVKWEPFGLARCAARGVFDPTAPLLAGCGRPFRSEIVTAFSHWAWFCMLGYLGHSTKVWERNLRSQCWLLPPAESPVSKKRTSAPNRSWLAASLPQTPSRPALPKAQRPLALTGRSHRIWPRP